MKYTILSLNASEREPYKEKIRRQMKDFEEIHVEGVDGNNESQLNANIDRHGFSINFDVWRPGEAGVWYSNINAWKYAAENDTDLMVFEDDAVLRPTFGQTLKLVTFPKQWDFITFYIPYVNKNQILPIRTFVPTYQEHGNVCVLYSTQGVNKILDLLDKEGLDWPVDIWLYKKALFEDKLLGFSPKRVCLRVVDVDYKVPSSIHDGERIRVHHPEKEEVS